MTETGTRAVRASFAEHNLLWTALHHLLPAALLRDLCDVTITLHAAPHRLTDLFHETLSGTDVLGSWAIAPRKVETPDLSHLQDHVRSLVWANDARVGPFTPRAETAVWVRRLASARAVGQLDLGVPKTTLDRMEYPEGDTLGRLVDAIRAAIDAVEPADRQEQFAIAGIADGLPRPLRTLVLKHIGDLFGDADAWGIAGDLYNEARASLGLDMRDEWSALANLLDDILVQSTSTALWISQGADAAAHRLTQLTEDADLGRLGVLNGSHEALMARLESRDRPYDGDRRAAVLQAPLLLNSHDAAAAMANWQAGKYDDAYRQFWAVLRRQMALGSHADSAATKSQYARAMLQDASHDPDQRYRPQTFELGALLLVEAGLSRGLETVEFSETAIRAYVSPDLINELSKKAARHPGAWLSRTRLLVLLVAKWAANAPKDDPALADRLLEVLIQVAGSFPAEFEVSRNAGGEALKALLRLARTRRDLRAHRRDAIADLIADKLEQRGWWTGTQDALLLAEEYSDVLDPGQLRQIIAKTLNLMPIAGAEGEPPFMKSALDFLASETSLDAARGDHSLAPGYVASLLRHGTARRSSAVTLLFALSRLAVTRDLPEAELDQLKAMIEEVRAGTQENNSSGVTDSIRAILLSASLAGPEAVVDAIKGLVAVLSPNQRGRRGLGFAYAYGPVMDLAETAGALVETAGVAPEILDDLLSEVESALTEAWTAILARPEMLAGFAVPPATHPNPTLVHNWVVATERFVTVRPQADALRDVVTRATAIAPLANIVARTSLATQSPSRLADGELKAIAEEKSDLFYGVLGRRLIILHKSTSADEQTLLAQALVRRCLVLGPREADLAVLTAALPYRGSFDPPLRFDDYHRAVLDQNLGLLFDPVLFAWTTEA